MNIFVLDLNPTTAARYLCDKHVVKMLLESTQMLCLAVPDELSPYKPTHRKHPCSIWALESKDNYCWLMTHAEAMSYEYTYRYGRIHKCSRVLQRLRKLNPLQFIPQGLQTPFALAMPDKYKHEDPVVAYRAFYHGDKAKFAKWNNGRSEPHWWQP